MNKSKNITRYLIPVSGFILVAILSFAVWAFGGKWFNSTWSLYLSCAVTFFLLGGISLLPFSGRESPAPYWGLIWIFPLSFTIYSLCWCLGWFTFRSHFGEILGSALGIFGMTALLKSQLGFGKTVLEAAAVVFLFYTLGYYLGEKIYQDTGGLGGKLGWGLGFGAGMGSGLVYLIQLPSKSRK